MAENLAEASFQDGSEPAMTHEDEMERARRRAPMDAVAEQFGSGHRASPDEKLAAACDERAALLARLICERTVKWPA